MDPVNTTLIIIIITVIVSMVTGCILGYKLGYDHGNRPLMLLFMNFAENSTYEVLAFSVSRNGEHTMFLKNRDKLAAYPLAAVSGKNLANMWNIGELVKTNNEKVLTKINA